MNKAVEHTIVERSAGRSVVSKLILGDFGLAKTFWGFGVLGNVLLNLLATLFSSPIPLLLLSVVATAYMAAVIVGVFRAADRYRGIHRFATLAKFVVSLWAIRLMVDLVKLAIAFSN